MSASIHLSLVLARFFRKSPVFGLCPSGRHSGKSTETLAIQPTVFHPAPTTPTIFNELLHPHLHCASLNVLLSLRLSLSLEGPPPDSGVGRGV